MIPKLHIETPRLIIRPPKLGDAKPLNAAINRSLDALEPWMPWASDPSLKTTETFIQKGIDEWNSEAQQIFPMIVVLKSTGEIISASGYNESSNLSVPSFEIGYWIDSKHSGHGYVTECVTSPNVL
ncbi:MAG: GNAT family N-acetyltransferase [Legionellaceae bacterium]|nr:GNAT family N-acetyltransferase [Legionellaceae bacterium]